MGRGRRGAVRRQSRPRCSRPRCSAPPWTSSPGWPGDGPALEFAIGTGRVAIPLAARGIPSPGSSCPRRWSTSCGARSPRRSCRSSSATWPPTTVPGQFSLVYLVCNTIGNLRTQDEQVRVLPQRRPAPVARWSLRHRAVGARHAAVPARAVGGAVRGERAARRLRHLRHGHPAGRPRTTTGGEADGSTRYGASNFRYIWPAECDLMARLAGLELEQRCGGLGRRARSPPTARATSRSGASHSTPLTRTSGAAGPLAGSGAPLRVHLRAASAESTFRPSTPSPDVDSIRASASTGRRFRRQLLLHLRPRGRPQGDHHGSRKSLSRSFTTAIAAAVCGDCQLYDRFDGVCSRRGQGG